METNNIVNLLKEALKFYANENNYIPITINAPIHIDHGNHARFALEQADKIDKIMNSAEDDFRKEISKSMSNATEYEDVLSLIEQYKNFKNDNNI